MTKYEDSIKCRYCGHFDPDTECCYMGSGFDQDMDSGGHHHYREYKRTTPDSRCSSFILPAMQTIMISGESEKLRRADGSYMVHLRDDPELKRKLEEDEKAGSRGCYIATAVYGSYDCPEVWTLRRYRDCTLAATWYGRTFIRMYYAVSPILVKWFGDKAWFKRLWRGKLDAMIHKLREQGVDSSPYQDKTW